MVDTWESLIRKGGFRYSKPDRSVMELVPFLKKCRVETILDAGCGAGRHTVLLAKNFSRVVGIDISQSALKIAERKLKSNKLNNFVLARCDIAELPFADKSFDAVVAFASLDKGRLPHIRRATREIYRVLKDGGILFATLASIDSDRFDEKNGELVEPYTIRYRNSLTYEHFFDERRAKNLLSGFSILRMEKVTQTIRPIKKRVRASGFDIIAKKRYDEVKQESTFR